MERESTVTESLKTGDEEVSHTHTPTQKLQAAPEAKPKQAKFERLPNGEPACNLI